MDYSLADVGDQQGACPQLQVLLDHALAVAFEFSKNELELHPLIRHMTKRFTHERMMIYLRQQAVRRISSELLRINVAEWFDRTQTETGSASPRFFVAKSPWYRFVAAYAAERGVRLYGYRNLPRLNISRLRILLTTARRILLRLPRRLVTRPRPKSPGAGIARRDRVAGRAGKLRSVLDILIGP